MERVVITVLGGVAEVYHHTPGVEVFIVDYDSIEEDDRCPICGGSMNDNYCDECRFDMDLDDPAEFIAGGKP